MVAQLARRHREEESFRSFDQLHVADDEGVVEGERAKRLESADVISAAAEIDANFSELHGAPQVARLQMWNTRHTTNDAPM
jgi:hypothetical protein